MVDFFMTGGLVNLLSTACVRKVDYPGHAHMRFYSQLRTGYQNAKTATAEILGDAMSIFFFYHLWSQEIIET